LTIFLFFLRVKMKTTAFYFALGRPFSPIYSLAMRFREIMYRRGMLQSYRMDIPVISVGNLTMGGTGKTPMVQYLARMLQQNGFHPAVISRGYGGSASAPINMVSDGRTLLLDAGEAGDEPRLLAETLSGVPVLTGMVRRLPAQRAVEMGADVLVLDDGFQHLQIIRDVNLVLFNTDRLAGNSRVFPGGDLREPVTALQRATRFIMTGVQDTNREQAIRFAELLRLKFPHIPVTHTGYRVEGLVELSAAGMIEPVVDDSIDQEKCFGFCGIAHPESFRQTLASRGITLTDFLPLDDHQRYSKALVDKLIAKAQQSGAKRLITTEKDLVKLAAQASGLSFPLHGLRMQVEAGKSFVQEILGVIRSWTVNKHD
jgi:tetraacyldisaccharide 4'-kinase